MTANIVSCF